MGLRRLSATLQPINEVKGDGEIHPFIQSTETSISSLTMNKAGTNGFHSLHGLTKSPKMTRPLRILLVDDSLAILKMTQTTLTKLGHQVFTAKNGARALAEMERLVLDVFNGTADVESGCRLFGGLDLVLMDLQACFLLLLLLPTLTRCSAPFIRRCL